MDKEKEKKIIKIAEREIKKFVKEWKKDPYLWESELDVHAELYSKIKKALCSAGFKPRKSRCPFTENGRIKQLPTEEKFNWIYCAPKTYIKNKRNQHPDLVIYKDTKEITIDGTNCPMLWVCEIKYMTEWSSDVTVGIVNEAIDGLKDLLKQKNDKIKGADRTYLLVLMRWNEEKRPDIKEKINRKIERLTKIIMKKPKKGKKPVWYWQKEYL